MRDDACELSILPHSTERIEVDMNDSKVASKVAFNWHVKFIPSNWLALCFDYTADLFFIIDITLYLESVWAYNKVAVAPQKNVGVLYTAADSSGDIQMSNSQDAFSLYNEMLEAFNRNVKLKDDQCQYNKNRYSRGHVIPRKFSLLIVLETIMVIPYDVISYWIGYEKYYLLRILKFLRSCFVVTYTKEFVDLLATKHLITGPSTKRALYVTMSMIVYAHVGACLMYKVAVISMSRADPVVDTWLSDASRVPMVEFNESDQNFIFIRSLMYRYIRSLYYAVSTAQTVGYGDVVPVSNQDTTFSILFMFFSHIMAQYAIGNIILLVTAFDSAHIKYREQLRRLEKYSQFRSLPRDLVDRIKLYYDHQYKVLNGLDEEQVLAELPPNIQARVRQATVRDFLKNVHFMRNLRLAILNALAAETRNVLYSSHDVIVSPGSVAKGMHILSRGEAYVHTDVSGNEGVEIVKALRRGESFSAHALVQKFKYSSALLVGNCVTEMLFLSRASFQRICRLYMTDMDYRQFAPPDVNSAAISRLRRVGIIFEETPVDDSASETTPSTIQRGLHVEVKTRWATAMKPGSNFRRMWEMVVFMCLIYHTITIPYLLANTFDSPFFERYKQVLSLCFAVDFIFAVDLVFRSLMFFYVRDRSTYTRAVDIFNFFAKAKIFIGRMTKVVLLLRLSEYTEKFERILASTKYFDFSFEVKRMGKLYFALFQLCHWMGCIWQLTADISTNLFGYRSNWKLQDKHSDVLSVEYPRLFGVAPYRRSMYWAINSLTTAGAGDMISTNIVEMAVCCVIHVIGCQTMNGLIGSIASLMGNMNTEKKNFHSKLSDVQELIRYRGLSPDLEERILYFFHYSWARSKGVDEAELMNGLSQPLRDAVRNCVIGKLINAVPFFANITAPMTHRILKYLSHRLFLDGDDIIVHGEYGKEMFIIESGHVVVCSADRSVVYATLQNGNYIGESCLLKVAKRTASAYAVDYTETYVLHKDHFEMVLEAFPIEGEDIVEAISIILEEKNSKNIEKLSLAEEIKKDSYASDSKSVFSFEQKTSVSSRDTLPNLQGLQFREYQKYFKDGSLPRHAWDTLLLFILLYNLGMIPLRVAERIHVLYFSIDYSLDVILLIDSYLNWTFFPKVHNGRQLMRPSHLNHVYMQNTFILDVSARFPYDLFALLLLGFNLDDGELFFALSILRLPKLLLLLKGIWMFRSFEALLDDLKLTFLVMRLLQVIVAVVLVCHWLACGLLLFTETQDDNCKAEPNAMYGTACEYKDTWVQFQIYRGRLPQNGGTQLNRYMRAINWAIPTTVLYTVGDTYPMNQSETTYMFLAMFFGIAVSAMIIGEIIALMTSEDEERTAVTNASEVFHTILKSRKVPRMLIKRVDKSMKFLTSDSGLILKKEDMLLRDLPYSLQVAAHVQIKVKFFKGCQLFDFCPDDILAKLCMKLKQGIYAPEDVIISSGDLGDKMFFIDSGVVEITSADRQTVYAQLQNGRFFGETGLVFRSRRTASAIALTLCVCYSLCKEDLDGELRDCDFDADATIQALYRLQQANARRNAAVTKNLSAVKNQGTKLSKLVGSLDADVTPNIWQKLANSHGTFKLCVDIFGLLALLYYSFVITFEITYMFGEHVEEYQQYYMFIDFVVDGLCILELLFRLYLFPVSLHETPYPGQLYKSSASLMYDVLGSIPMEMLVLASDIEFGNIFALRLIHLLRLGNLFERVSMVESHMKDRGLTFYKQTMRVVWSLLSYVVATHLLACMYFCTHRYIEDNYRTTWVIEYGYAKFDDSKGKHNVCSSTALICYERSLYFIVQVLTSVGYGDIAPFTNAEVLNEIVVAITAACMAANLCGQMMTYLKIGDKSGSASFSEKLRTIDRYMNYRNLPQDLRDRISCHYHTLWNRYRSTGDDRGSLSRLLSTPLAESIAWEFNKDVMNTVPLLKSIRPDLRNAIAGILKPQMLLPSTNVYSESDPGASVFFVLSGCVSVKLAKDSSVEGHDIGALMLLKLKHERMGDLHQAGYQFGEFCLLSKLGIRVDTAVAEEYTESYYFSDGDLWTVFGRMTFSERYNFILSLFSEVKGHQYVPKLPPAPLKNDIEGKSAKVLNAISVLVLENLISSISTASSADSKDAKYSTVNDMQRSVSADSFYEDITISSGTTRRYGAPYSRWLDALKAYDRTHYRKSSEFRASFSENIRNHFEAQRVDSYGDRESEDKSESGGSDEENDDIYSDERAKYLKERILDLFSFIDTNRSGSIDRKELFQSLINLGIEKSWEEVDAMIAVADKDGSGDVDIDELVSVILRGMHSIQQ